MVPLVFFGSSLFSVIVLQKLLKAKSYRLTAVVTTPDQPAGRGLKLKPNPVKLLAQKNRIPVLENLHPLNVSPPAVGLVAAYGKIIPPNILDKFNNQIYNIHPSLLPKYRGPSPLQQQILDGVVKTGITLIQIDSQMDHGPIVAVAKDTIHPDDTWITLGSRLFAKGVDLFLSLNIKHLTLSIQNDAQASFTRKLTRQDGFLPWLDFLKFDYDRKFRAFFNWPGIWTTDPNGTRVKLVSLHPVIIQYSGQKPKAYVHPRKLNASWSVSLSENPRMPT